MDNADADEFTADQLHWLRSVLDYDLSPKSGITTIVMGAHEALPHSTGVIHAMDDWNRGVQTGEIVYHWFYDAEAAGRAIEVGSNFFLFFSSAMAGHSH